MTPFEELATSREYWLTKIQNELYDCVEQHLERKGWTRTQLAEHLGVTKGYVSQILNGDFDHKLSKLIELSLAVGVVPNVHFQEAEQYIADCLRSSKLLIDTDVFVDVATASYTGSEYAIDSQQTNYSKQVVDNGMFVSFSREFLVA